MGEPPHEARAWPPPDHASGCVVGRLADGSATPPLSLFHYTAGGSRWGYCVERYATHGRQTVAHPECVAWSWIGPAVPSIEAQGRAVMVWTWQTAPGELRALSNNGGDEDAVALAQAGDELPSWFDTFHFDDPERHELADGRTVYIWSHA